MSGDIEYCSKWLKDMRGESLGLSDSDWKLLFKVQSMAPKHFKTKTTRRIKGEMSEELSSLVSCLQKLVEHQKMYSDFKQYFQQNYPKWRQVRGTTIKTLKEIADTIQENKENCDGVRLAGSVVSLIGGGTTLLADEDDDDSFLAELGRGISFLGSAVAAGSTIFEEISLDVKIKEAKAIVEKDRFLFNFLWSSHVDSCGQVASSIDKIFEEIDMNRHHWKKARQTIEYFLSETSKDRRETEVEMLVKDLMSFTNIPRKYQGEICDVAAAIMAIVMVWENHRPLFELVSSAYKFKRQFEIFSGGLLSVFNVWSKFGSSETKKSVVIVGMLMDVLSIAKSSSEIANKEQRKESELLRKVANTLEDEADNLRGLYYQFTANGMDFYL